MKILITENFDKTIDGYTTVPIIQSSLSTIGIPQNSCDHILIEHGLNAIKDIDILSELCGKIRKKGIMTIVGTEIYCMCQNLLNKRMSNIDFSNYVTAQKQLWSMERVMDEFKKHGMIIVSCQLKGISYEVSARRS